MRCPCFRTMKKLTCDQNQAFRSGKHLLLSADILSEWFSSVFEIMLAVCSGMALKDDADVVTVRVPHQPAGRSES